MLAPLVLALLAPTAAPYLSVHDPAACIETATVADEMGPLPPEARVEISVSVDDGEPTGFSVAIFLEAEAEPALLRDVPISRADCPDAGHLAARIVERFVASLPETAWPSLKPDDAEEPAPPAPPPPTTTRRLLEPPPPAWSFRFSLEGLPVLGLAWPEPAFGAALALRFDALREVGGLRVGAFLEGVPFAWARPGISDGMVVVGEATLGVGLALELADVAFRLSGRGGGGVASGLGYATERVAFFPAASLALSVSRRWGWLSYGVEASVPLLRPRFVVVGGDTQSAPPLWVGLRVGLSL